MQEKFRRELFEFEKKYSSLKFEGFYHSRLCGDIYGQIAGKHGIINTKRYYKLYGPIRTHVLQSKHESQSWRLIQTHLQIAQLLGDIYR